MLIKGESDPMMPPWERLARRAARREAATRRYFRRIWPLDLDDWGAYQRQAKRGEHLNRDFHKLRLISVVAAVEAGIDAEGWQDVYYGEILLHGEKPPTGVAQRFAARLEGTTNVLHA